MGNWNKNKLFHTLVYSDYDVVFVLPWMKLLVAGWPAKAKLAFSPRRFSVQFLVAE
jgi:hypothetical protein